MFRKLPLLPHICDTGILLREAEKAGKSILFEAQLGALRDIDFGIYPYTSSSSPIAAYAPVGCGAPWLKLDSVIGVVKAYSTCVGEGPFTAEWFGEDAEKLRRHALRCPHAGRDLHCSDQTRHSLLYG